MGLPNPLLHSLLKSFASTSRQPLEPPSQEKVWPEVLPGVVSLRFLRSWRGGNGDCRRFRSQLIDEDRVRESAWKSASQARKLAQLLRSGRCPDRRIANLLEQIIDEDPDFRGQQIRLRIDEPQRCLVVDLAVTASSRWTLHGEFIEMPTPAMVAIFWLRPSSTTSRHPARCGSNCAVLPSRPTSGIGDCSLKAISQCLRTSTTWRRNWKQTTR